MKLTLLLWVLGVLVGLAALVSAFLLIRLYVLSRRPGSFRTLLRVVSPDHHENNSTWMRGYACYGQTNMAWSRLVRLRLSPDLLLARTSLEMNGPPLHDPAMGTTTLWLRDGQREYQVVLSSEDYQGLISWVDSSPPQSH